VPELLFWTSIAMPLSILVANQKLPESWPAWASGFGLVVLYIVASAPYIKWDQLTKTASIPWWGIFLIACFVWSVAHYMSGFDFPIAFRIVSGVVTFYIAISISHLDPDKINADLNLWK
jgi:hypothetical protein